MISGKQLHTYHHLSHTILLSSTDPHHITYTHHPTISLCFDLGFIVSNNFPITLPHYPTCRLLNTTSAERTLPVFCLMCSMNGSLFCEITYQHSQKTRIWNNPRSSQNKTQNKNTEIFQVPTKPLLLPAARHNRASERWHDNRACLTFQTWGWHGGCWVFSLSKWVSS